ncbi:MAG: hypothetical protein WCS85_00205 [Candidatus Peribacteraceae bacterium]|jgi:hypothetical protein
MAEHILFVGTVHCDPDIDARLERMLDIERPDCVTMEYTPASEPHHLATRDRMLRLFKERKKREIPYDVAQYIRHQAEHVLHRPIEVLRKYCAGKEIPPQFIDHPGSYQMIEQAIPLPDDSTFIRNLILGNASVADIRSKTQKDYLHLHQLFLANEPEKTMQALERCRALFHIGSALRDVYPAAKILEAAQSTKGKLLYVTGAMHMLDDPRNETVFSMLKDRFPIRRQLLDEYDQDAT